MHGNRIIAISNDGLKARRTVYIRGNRLDEAMKRASLYLGHGGRSWQRSSLITTGSMGSSSLTTSPTSSKVAHETQRKDRIRCFDQDRCPSL